MHRRTLRKRLTTPPPALEPPESVSNYRATRRRKHCGNFSTRSKFHLPCRAPAGHAVRDAMRVLMDDDIVRERAVALGDGVVKDEHMHLSRRPAVDDHQGCPMHVLRINSLRRREEIRCNI